MSGRLPIAGALAALASLALPAAGQDQVAESTSATAGDRARAWRAAEARLVDGGTGDLDAALGDLVHPDPGVRDLALRFLERPGLAELRAGERVEAFERTARADPEPDLRRRAIAALGGIEHPEAVSALARLAREVPQDEQLEVVRALADLRGSGTVLATLLASGLGESAALTAPAIAELLEAHAKRLPELPGGGLTPEERAPLIAARTHPAEEVREAARLALGSALERYLWLGSEARIAPFLDACIADGLDPYDLSYRAAALALSQGGAPDLALELGRRIESIAVAEEARGGSERPARQRFHGLYLQAAAHLARRDAPAALERLDAAEQALLARASLRTELRSRGGEPSEPDVRASVDTLESLSLVHAMRAIVRLASGAAVDAPEVTDSLRRAHVESLRAGWVDVAFDLGSSGGSLDGVLDRDLAPRRLLAGSREFPRWTRSQWLELLESFGRAMRAVVGPELPGFEATELADSELADPLADPLRLTILRATQESQLESVARRLSDPDEVANRRLWMQFERDLLAKLQRADPQDLWDLRSPSLWALDLAQDWRGEGESERAVQLLERLRTDLETTPFPLSAVFTDWLQARLSLALGSCLSDLDRPEAAEAELLGAEARLIALENALEARLDELDRGRMGALFVAVVDPESRAQLEAQVRQTERLRSDVLVSLAVNANVRLRDPERALGYFERAHALEQNDFMTVLAACYRARAGLEDEARYHLARVAPSPELAYNLACTWALLGDAERALEHLRRDFEDLERSPSALARQKRWAAGDPDLASLRDDPRFQALVEVDE